MQNLFEITRLMETSFGHVIKLPSEVCCTLNLSNIQIDIYCLRFDILKFWNVDVYFLANTNIYLNGFFS